MQWAPTRLPTASSRWRRHDDCDFGGANRTHRADQTTRRERVLIVAILAALPTNVLPPTIAPMHIDVTRCIATGVTKYADIRLRAPHLTLQSELVFIKPPDDS